MISPMEKNQTKSDLKTKKVYKAMDENFAYQQMVDYKYG